MAPPSADAEVPVARRPWTRVWLAIGVACLLVLAAFVAIAWHAYDDKIADAERESMNLTLVLDEHLRRVLRVVDLSVTDAQRMVEALPGGPTAATDEEVSRLLERQHKGNAELLNLFVLGADGRSRGDALATPPGTSSGDRSFFLAHRDGSAGGLFISEPVESRTGRGWVIIASRRLAEPDGRFAGVVGASIAIETFQAFYRQLDIGTAGTITLRDHAGVVFARHPELPEAIGKARPDAEVVEAVAAGRHQGTLRLSNLPRTPDRITSYRMVEGTPFIVSVSFARDAVLVHWRGQVAAYGALALAMMAALAALVFSIARQIDSRQRIDRALRESEASARRAAYLLADAIEALPATFVLFDADRRLVMTNRKTAETFPALAPYYVPGARYEDLLRKVEERGLVAGARGSAWAAERLASYDLPAVDTEVEMPGGRWLHSIARRTSDGGRVFMNVDITEAKRSQAALEESEAKEREARLQLQTILDRMPIGCLISDADLRMTYWNPAAEKIFGCSFEEVKGQAPFETGFILTDRAIVETLHQRLRRGEFVGQSVATNLTRDGRRITCEWTNTPLMGPDGSFQGVLAMCQDITQRAKTEAALQQAVKMEAVGQLTSGIAHDFNNLLTVILGSAGILADELSGNADLRQQADIVEGAALRAAALTQRLLAFARQLPLNAASLDMNAMVRGMEELLRRTLGEQVDIALELSDGAAPVVGDRALLESALLNLAINARDAMPEGGALIIGTGSVIVDGTGAVPGSDLKPGRYGLLSVTDTGTGMTPEVQRRVFEPFFTTKEIGKGSGLGLSMVFGFARQSGGDVRIYSEVGLGTTIRLYLPEAGGEEAGPVESEAVVADGPGSERILLVEDDDAVRVFATSALRRLGYDVHEARDGAEALALLKEIGPVDLLATDVVLPNRMNGRQVAEEARRLIPGLRVLYMSGYTAGAFDKHGHLPPGSEFLSKPYRKADLAAAVRHALRPLP